MTPLQQTSSREELVWRGELGLQRIVKLKEDLGVALDAAAEVQLRLVDVSEVDVAFLQLLCSAHRSAVGRDKQLRLVGPLPGPFVEVVRLAGLSRHVGCQLASDGSCLWTDLADRL